MSWAVAAIAVTAWMATFARGRHRALALARTLHEVRGALTVIGLGLELGARAGRLAPERLVAMEQQVRRAVHALATLDGGSQPVGEPTRLGDAVRALAGARPGIEVEIDGEPEVSVDAGRLAQVLENLVANAFEHGGPPVRVRVSGDGERARIEVTDAGPGLPATLATLATRSRSGRRHGHGLAIAIAAARADGGRIWSSPSRHGARVVVEYPRLRASEDADAVIHPGGYRRQSSTLGCSSATTGSQPASSSASSDGGVRTSSDPRRGRATRSV